MNSLSQTGSLVNTDLPITRLQSNTHGLIDQLEMLIDKLRIKTQSITVSRPPNSKDTNPTSPDEALSEISDRQRSINRRFEVQIAALNTAIDFIEI